MAISIDENRANFARVPWHSVKQTSRDERGLQWFEQVWFSGVHADVGGGYPENESRLSDFTLNWMLQWAILIAEPQSSRNRAASFIRVSKGISVEA